MTVSVTDSEQWYTAYEEASAKQQYDMLLEAIAQPLTPELIEELDLGMLLVMMRDELVNHNLLDQAITLIHTLQQQQPELHQQEFLFLDNLLVQYYLYKNDLEQVRSALKQFIAKPAEDIDQTLAILDYLKLYNAVDLTVELSKAAYEPVQTSPTAMLGADMEFGNVLLYYHLQHADEHHQRSEPIDWEAFLAEVTQYGFERKPKWVAELQNHLTTDVQGSPEFFARFKRDRREALRALSIIFCRYMAEQKQLDFIGSAAIWGAVIDFLEHRKTSKKKLAQPNDYFSFPHEELNQHVAQKIGGLLSMEQALGVGMLWGIPYVYDVLQSKQIISDEVHDQAIAIANNVKTELIENYQHLWKFDFVHRWQPPDSISAETFAAEAQQFAASLEQVTPLSDEPGQGVTQQNFIETIKKELPPEVVAAIEQVMEEYNEEEDEGDLEDEEESLSWLNSSAQSFKPAKPHKSALQLAAELPDKDIKGFGNSPRNRKKKR